MNAKTSIAAFAALTLCLPAAHAMASPATNDAPLELVPHEVVVKFAPNARANDLAMEIPDLQVRMIASDLGVARLVPAGALLYRSDEARTATYRLLDRVRRHPAVALAQPNHRFQLAEVGVTPQDPLYSQQWHLPAIGMPQAWANAGGGSSAVKIAILDTGRSSMDHPDLVGRWSPLEYNAAVPGSAATERNHYNHGVHVAGIVGAATHNNIGIAGICYNCTLLNVKVTHQGTGVIETAHFLDGLRWAVANGARVVNMSFAYPTGCASSEMDVVRSQLERAAEQGVMLVASAGNHATNVANASPASCPGVISVAASTPANQLASYSNRGAKVSITAPGGGGSTTPDASSMHGMWLGTPACSTANPNVFNPYTHGVVSTWVTRHWEGNTQVRIPCYRYLSGTSMSAPHVSGTIGLMLSVKPTLTPAQALSILQATATPMPSCGDQCGPGLLNAHLAISAAAN